MGNCYINRNYITSWKNFEWFVIATGSCFSGTGFGIITRACLINKVVSEVVDLCVSSTGVETTKDWIPNSVGCCVTIGTISVRSKLIEIYFGIIWSLEMLIHWKWDMVCSHHLCILTVSAKWHPVIHCVASVSFVVVHLIMWFMEETSSRVNIGLDCFLVRNTRLLVWNLLTLFLAQFKWVFRTINAPVITLSNGKFIRCYKTKRYLSLDVGNQYYCICINIGKLSIPLGRGRQVFPSMHSYPLGQDCRCRVAANWLLAHPRIILHHHTPLVTIVLWYSI